MKIAAHITTFENKKSVFMLVKRLLEIKPEICKIYIVVNAGHDLKFDFQNEKINITYLDKNYGVGKAVNISMENAVKDQMDWLWLFDDDSLPFSNTLGELVKMTDNDFFILASAYLQPMDDTDDRMFLDIPLSSPYELNYGGYFTDKVKPAKPKKEDFERGYLEGDFVITSGSLVNVKMLKESGLRMAEEMFMNALDFEFCWQAKKRGYKIVCILNSLIYHCVGTPKNFFMIKLLSYNALHYRTAIRNYYIFTHYYLKSKSLEQTRYILFTAFIESLRDRNFSRIKECFRGLSEIKEMTGKLKDRIGRK